MTPFNKGIAIATISGAILLALIIIFGKHGEGPRQAQATLSTEQQELVGDLRTAKRGDIIAYPNKGRYLIVRKVYVDADADHRRSLLVSYFHFGFTEGQELRTQDELTRLNCRVIYLNSDEWVQIMRRSFRTDPDSLSK
jgi:hypothetical protein